MSFSSNFKKNSPLHQNGENKPVKKQNSTYGLGNVRGDVNTWSKPKSTTMTPYQKDFYKRMTEVHNKNKLNRALDSAQDKIETAGMLPIAGAIPDVVNTAISGARSINELYKGNTDKAKTHLKNAVIHGSSSVPLFGIGVAATNKVVKYAPKIKKNLNTGKKALEGLGPRALKNDGALKRGVNKAGYKDFKKTGLVREKQGGVTNKPGAFELGKNFSNKTYFSPDLKVAKKPQYYGSGGAIYDMKNKNIKFKNQYKSSNWSMVTKDPITKPDVDVYRQFPILGFRKVNL